jgi:hypothetical protein
VPEFYSLFFNKLALRCSILTTKGNTNNYWIEEIQRLIDAARNSIYSGRANL